ncbi:MAG: DUF192 domain-containing protein [Bryobacteraceae bacterium]
MVLLVMHILKILNRTRDTILATQASIADTSGARNIGLLRHHSLPDGQGLWIVPCEGVHTFFMKFPIDVVYLDRNKRVVKVRPNLVPWRISLCLRAHSVLELPAGKVAQTGTSRGDQLEFSDAEA